MITISDTTYSSDISLAAILVCKTKEGMVKIADRLDLVVDIIPDDVDVLPITIRRKDAF